MLAHHAYYIEGSTANFEAYRAQLKPLWAEKFDRFGIDEARELIEKAALKNFRETIFFVGASSITSEAQQALLKLFEEPQRGTVFVLLVPHGILLPTLRSRMLEYPKPVASKDFLKAQVKEFLKSDGKARSAQVTEILKDEDDQKERVRDFVNALEAQLAPHIAQPEVRAGLSDIAKVRSYVGDRSPSLKMLLEHLALSLPKI